MSFLWDCLPGLISEVVTMLIVADFLMDCAVFLIDDFQRLRFSTFFFLSSVTYIGVYHYVSALGRSRYEGDSDFLFGA